MITPYYQDESVSLHHGDCLDVLRADDYGYDWNLGYRSARMFPDNSVDAVITDPPYGIAFMGKAWDQPGEFGSQCKNGTPAVTRRARPNRDSNSGAMEAGRYDLSPAAMLNFQRWCTAWATECLRILKPGGHLLAFGGSRTWHRLAAAIEDAGFEIRDSIAWLYGSGFPKSMDVSKAIASTELGYGGNSVAQRKATMGDNYVQSGRQGNRDGAGRRDTGLAEHTLELTESAQAWQGWGTALKPSFEPIVVARKPLAGTVAANVLEYGTGALNIDACRIPTGDKLGGGSTTRGQRMKDGWHRPWMDDPDMVAANAERSRASVARSEELGRWPTNVVLDERQAEALDRQTGVLHSGTMRAGTNRQPRAGGTIYGADTRTFAPADTYGDSGGASRFFPVFRYEAKAPTSERPNADGMQHPTVKPLELMRTSTDSPPTAPAAASC
ncbi:DNA methyltransferase [Mycobacteroides abscessus]|uniref:DNA methyltransferase n=1 Tax=Mycobacteroides abscessus TaxID=36809 RepID=UPI0009261206|nr:DNA methyltransferase [Mycobacteroides abscessus]QST89612.1 DNA methylase [Mycobacterium phage prophi62-3]QST89954.1 DNA methylase [Mycobacterium phage prophi108-1]MBN7454289.1 site-specific DNA-methyltransferase [Mycobacteroides abscessus subsp. abscessus]MBN7542368.1 site-specific DNA-methyltransferase [Mycobacteroides abscessus subsp. abscessus]MBN7569949.1 site-specific DNA-methyltransferase [Mycobacteroides abscessus subsp. abscessus]